MKHRLTPSLFALILPALAWAADPGFSPETSARLRATVPAYDPAQHAAEEARRAEQPVDADSEVMVLPEMTVQEKSLKRMEDETLYRRGAWDKELVQRELGEFDRFFLNRFTLPLFGISKEARAREAYLERKNREFREKIANVSAALRTVDEAEAAALETVMLDTARSGVPVESRARPANWR